METNNQNLSNYQLYDDLFPPSLVCDIEAALTPFEMPWNYIDSSSGTEELYTGDHEFKKDCPQMVHMIYSHDKWISPLESVAKSMLYFVEQRTETKITAIERIKANLLLPDGTDERYYNTPHIDSPNTNALVLLYYVHNTDGDTILFDKAEGDQLTSMKIVERVTPVRGRSIIFPARLYHSSCNPINYRNRIILNFVFQI